MVFAADASERKLEAPFVIVQWNVAGVNDNAFEFRQSEGGSDGTRGPAIRFQSRLSDALKSIVKGTVFDPSLPLGCAPVSELLTAMQTAAASHPERAVAESLAQNLLEAAGRSLTVAELLRKAAEGDSLISRASLMFSKQECSITKLRPSSVKKMIELISTQDRLGFWRWYIESLLENYPEALRCVAQLWPLVAFDGILFEAASKLCEGEAKVSELCSSLVALTADMCVAVDAKANKVSRFLQGVPSRCQPDVIALQEFSHEWLSDMTTEAFRTWQKLLDSYDVFEPAFVKSDKQVTRLLLRKRFAGGRLHVKTESTEVLVSGLRQDAFAEQLRQVYIEMFGAELGEKMQARALGEDGFVFSKMVFALCSSDQPASRFLVVAGHASSDGSDNRALVAAAVAVASAQDVGLILALDANSADFETADVAVAGQARFLQFLEQQNVRTCFESCGTDVGDPKRFHTVRKCRSWVQPQLRKADKFDVSAKDFVLTGNMRTTRFCGIRVNTADWLDMPVPVLGSTMPFSEDATWKDELNMPTADFCSDHALVLAYLSCNEAGSPAQ